MIYKQLQQQSTNLQVLYDAAIRDIVSANKLLEENCNMFLERSSKKKAELIDEVENCAHKIHAVL